MAKLKAVTVSAFNMTTLTCTCTQKTAGFSWFSSKQINAPSLSAAQHFLRIFQSTCIEVTYSENHPEVSRNGTD
jgi:hypothetical protein